MCSEVQYLREKSALPVLRSSVLVSVVGSVVKCSSFVEEEAFVELPATSVGTVVGIRMKRKLYIKHNLVLSTVLIM